MLVDYNVAIVMLPSIVLGVIAGGIVNSVFPSIYLAVGLVLLLVFIITSTWRKLCLIQDKEAASHGPLCGCCSKKEEAAQPTGINEEPPAGSASDAPSVEPKQVELASNEKAGAAESDGKALSESLERIIAAESTNLQWKKLALNYGMLVIMIVCMLLRGPASKPSMIGVERCDALDFIFLGIVLVGAVVLTAIAIKITAAEYEQKVGAGYTFVAGDVEFTPINTLKLLCFAFFFLKANT